MADTIPEIPANVETPSEAHENWILSKEASLFRLNLSTISVSGVSLDVFFNAPENTNKLVTFFQERAPQIADTVIDILTHPLVNTLVEHPIGSMGAVAGSAAIIMYGYKMYAEIQEKLK